MRLKQKISPDDRIMAIDPGGTCGFASCGLAIADNQCFQRKFSLHDQFLGILNDFYPDILIMEKFVKTHRDGTDFTAVEFIGLGRWFAQQRRITFVLQLPASGKGYFTNEKLRKLGLYMPASGHAMDAMRHLLQFKMDNDLFDLKLLKDD